LVPIAEQPFEQGNNRLLQSCPGHVQNTRILARRHRQLPRDFCGPHTGFPFIPDKRGITPFSGIFKGLRQPVYRAANSHPLPVSQVFTRQSGRFYIIYLILSQPGQPFAHGHITDNPVITKTV
jgi:hypothetical protein